MRRAMTKKTPICVLYALSILSLGHLFAADCDEHEDAFYALSSLSFHFEEEIEPIESTTDRIDFDISEVANLWERARAAPYGDKIVKAENHYLNALIASPEERHILLSKGKKIIDHAWTNLNPYSERPSEKVYENHRYVLRKDHWLRDAMDDIFKNFDAQKNSVEFDKAAFRMICKRTNDMIVADHANIPGYVIKIYLLEDKPEQSWRWMVNRCKGAENVRNLIARKNLEHFIVPDKWIYELPGSSHIAKGEENTPIANRRTPACLIATKMNIGSSNEARRAWKEKITRAHLRELYCIFSHGFASTFLHQNIPYTKEGKFACLDTEVPFRHHKYSKVTPYLSPKMQEYWKLLVKTGGKAN